MRSETITARDIISTDRSLDAIFFFSFHREYFYISKARKIGGGLAFCIHQEESWPLADVKSVFDRQTAAGLS